MIHGDCSSRGCYAMTDEQIGEIYSLARESFLGGQQSFQIQAYPFRMTPPNMARHRTNPNMAFWKMIKEGNDHFEVTHLEPKVDVCDRHYVFDAQQPPSIEAACVQPDRPLPGLYVAPEIAEPALDKQHNDEVQYAQLSRSYADRADQDRPRRRHEQGLPGANRRQHPAGAGAPATAAGAAAARGRRQWRPQPTLASRMFGGLFGSKRPRSRRKSRQRILKQWSAAKPTAAASSTACSHRRNRSRHAVRAAPTTTATVDRPKAKPAHITRPRRLQRSRRPSRKQRTAQGRAARNRRGRRAKAKPAPQKEANAAAPPATTALLNGAQAVVPAGSFDSRWGGLQ